MPPAAGVGAEGGVGTELRRLLDGGDLLAQARNVARRIVAVENTLGDGLVDRLHQVAQLLFNRLDLPAGYRFSQLANGVTDAGADGTVARGALGVLSVALDSGLVTLCQSMTSLRERERLAQGLAAVNASRRDSIQNPAHP